MLNGPSIQQPGDEDGKGEAASNHESSGSGRNNQPDLGSQPASQSEPASKPTTKRARPSVPSLPVHPIAIVSSREPLMSSSDYYYDPWRMSTVRSGCPEPPMSGAERTSSSPVVVWDPIGIN